ncbi:MAG: ATP-binding protein [Pseudoruegeria sp.]
MKITDPLTSFLQQYRYLFLTVFVATGLGFLGYLALETRARIDLLQRAPNDNARFIFSQLEIESLQLTNAMKEARSGAPEKLSNVRLRFDLFYSRVQIVAARQKNPEMQSTGSQFESVDALQDYLSDTIPFIDGPDAALWAALPALANRLSDLYGEIRKLSLETLTQSTQIADDRRSEIRLLLLQTSSVSGVLVLALGIIVVFLMRLSQKTSKLAQEAQRTRDRLRSTVAASLDAVIVVDEDSRILDYSGAAETIFGYKKEAVLGELLPPLMIPDRYHESHYSAMRHVSLTGQKHISEDRLIQVTSKRATGEEFTSEATITSIPSVNGILFVAFVRDISVRLQAQSDLVAARDRAVAAEKVKSDFIAVMSHEMRTPLNGMMAGLELIEGDNLSEKQNRYLNVARKTSHQLLGHVNDVLQISEIEAGKMRLSSESFAPSDLLDEIAVANAAIAASKNIHLSVKPITPELTTVYGDHRRLRQIILNLLGNSIKFTENGTVTLKCEIQDSDQEQHILRFEVEDTGDGIAKDAQTMIFEDFITLDSSYQRNTNGTGLGLSISRRMARAMGGDIFVESTLGQGSRFWVELPFPRTEGLVEAFESSGVETPSVTPSAAREVKVLIVEDNEINRMIANEFVSSVGATAVEAHNGEIGVQLASETHFDLILMDISMPVMNGRIATRAIREKGASMHTPILGLTAHAQSSDIVGFLEDGMQCVLVKPINQDHIRTAITKHVLLPEKGVPSGPSRRLVNEKTVLELRGILGPTSLEAMFNRFATEMETGLDTSRKSFEFREEFHRLAGSAGAMGAVLLQRVLADAEQTPQQSSPDMELLQKTWGLTRKAYADIGVSSSVIE